MSGLVLNCEPTFRRLEAELEAPNKRIYEAGIFDTLVRICADAQTDLIQAGLVSKTLT